MTDHAGGHGPASGAIDDRLDVATDEARTAAHDAHAAAAAGTHGGVHGDAGEPLGPIDVAAWVYALAGAAFGIVAAGALYVAAR